MSQDVIRPLCDLLTVMDSKIVQVALSGLENILRIGKQDALQTDGVNQFAVMVEEAYGKEFLSAFDGEMLQFLISVPADELKLTVNTFLSFIGLDKIEFLQSHDNEEIYRKAFEIIEYYFSGEDEDDKIMPGIDQSSDQYQFGTGVAMPQGGFQL